MRTLYRNILFGFLILLSPHLIKAQGQANVWYFGNGNGLDFNYTPPVKLENGNTALGALNYEGVGAISDANGNLLFYTDGRSVFTKTHLAMPSGTGLLGGDGSATQSGLVIPVNGSTTQYFIISNDNAAFKSYYSIVDMTLNGGLGDVTATKNSPLVAANCSEGVVAIPEYNASNVPTGESWVVFHDMNSGNFRVYKTNGTTIVFSNSYTVGFSPSQQALILKTNGCFDKIAISYYNYARVEILPFNNQTGVISAPSLIIMNDAISGITPFLNVEVYGIEFSPNDKFLYVSESGLNNRKTIYQFNINGASGTNPAAVIASRSYFTGGAASSRFGHVQLGPDGKIYVPAFNFSGTTYMSCIPTPNVAWAGATPTASEFQYLQYTYNYVGNRVVGEGLPVFSQAILRQVKVFVTNACEGSPANFSYTFGGSAVSQTWNFGDPGSGALNTSTSAFPSHTYATAGTYTVTVNITDNCGRIRTGTANVVIKPGPQVSVPTNACPNQNVTFTGTGTNAASYVWSSSASMTPVLTTGSTYTYNGPLPYTVYVKDPTPAATYTTGNSTAAATAGADVGHTYFELLTTVTLTQFQVIARISGQAANFSIKSEDLLTNYYTVAAPVSVGGTTYTFNPNITLSPGRYVLYTSNVNYAFRNNTSYNGGRDVPGAINILGEKNGTKGGSFINIKFDLPDPCGVRAYTVVDNCPLPVGWLSFNARAEKESVGLWWNVSFEKDNSYFVVQRSEDGINFADIGIVNGRGNATTMASYTFTDSEPSITNYYRLKQVDKNGVFTYSSIATVELNAVNVWAAPNPFYNELTLTFTSDEAASIEVIDMTGRIVAAYDKAQGNLSFVLGAGLPPGAYLIKVVSSREAKTIPVIKK